jgi:heptosyltransferase-2
VAESLHNLYPTCKIDYLIKKGYENLFDNHPFINSVLLWNKKQKKYFNLLKIIVHVRRTHYDAVINIQRHFSSGLVTVLSGAAIRSGFKKNPLSFLFTHRYVHIISETEPFEHEIARNHKLITLFINVQLSKPGIYPSVADEVCVKEWTHENYITIAPASLWFTKQFPLNKWIEFVNELSIDINVYLLGASNDVPMCEQIVASTNRKNVVNLAGKLSTLQSAALMKGAIMNFVNDSAPLHLASATNAPVTAIFCSTLPAFGFGPLSDNSTVIETQEMLACRPCGLHGHMSCPENHFLCAEHITTNQLLDQIK